MIKWIRTSRLSTNNSHSLSVIWGGQGQRLLVGGDEVPGRDLCREDKPGGEEEREVACQRAREPAHRALPLKRKKRILFSQNTYFYLHSPAGFKEPMTWFLKEPRFPLICVEQITQDETGREEEGEVARQRAREPKTQKIRGELNMNTLDL